MSKKSNETKKKKKNLKKKYNNTLPHKLYESTVIKQQFDT